jgi:glutamate-1-semialdehyde 2,1-aminomutase
MIYGARWAKGGATEFFGVVPDLACFGKGIGNGAAIACVVGTKALEEHGELPSGTYSGETEALQAVANVMSVYKKSDVIGTLWRRGKQLRRGLDSAISESGWSGEASVDGAGDVHLRLRFATDEAKRIRLFSKAMAERAVLWHPQVVNVSMSHGADAIEEVVEKAYESLLVVARESGRL